jgi:hypothetical protein
MDWRVNRVCLKLFCVSNSLSERKEEEEEDSSRLDQKSLDKCTGLGDPLNRVGAYLSPV